MDDCLWHSHHSVVGGGDAFEAYIGTDWHTHEASEPYVSGVFFVISESGCNLKFETVEVKGEPSQWLWYRKHVLSVFPSD